MKEFDATNALFLQAASFVNHTQQTVFLTGKAGTGKTTFLKYIRENSLKKMAVVAPTGVAAINAQGTTIHSFFQLPLGTYIPSQMMPWGGELQNIYNKNQLLSNLRLRQAQRDVIKSLELLVIDEVSMVRADVLDAMDAVMRSVRRKPHEPFGGVQMLFIGDMYQLPPVVKQNEWNLIASHYKSPFFFDAQVMNEVSMTYIELEKIYRQRDAKFINILQNVRNNCCTREDLEILHEQYKPQFAALSGAGYITLTTHNRKADVINQIELDKLPGKAVDIRAIIEKNFPESAYPAEAVLRLKEGAQIMFIKNDKGEHRRYFNGKIGKIVKIDAKENSIQVAFENEPDTIDLELETWKNIRYHYDKEKDKINEQELGSFQQYPIRLAWAVTIHKSQGLTFEKAIIDAGQSFAPGQVYVALSRLTNLQGLILHSRIHPHNIMVDERITHFAEQKLSSNQLSLALQQAQRAYAHSLLLRAYDYENFTEAFRAHAASYVNKLIPDRNLAFEWAQRLLIPVYKQQETAQRFTAFLQGIFNDTVVNYARIHERNVAATSWFVSELEDHIIASLEKQMEAQKGKTRIKKYLSELNTLLDLTEQKKESIKRSVAITEVLYHKTDIREMLDKLKPAEIKPKVKNAKPSAGSSRAMSLQLYREGKTIEEIAAMRGFVPSTIASHLTYYIGEGEIAIDDLVNPEKRNIISTILEENPTATSSVIKEILGADFSYTEIKAVMAFEQNKAEAKKA